MRKSSINNSPRHKESLEDTKDTVYEHLPNYETILAFDLSHVHKELGLMPSEFDISSRQVLVAQERKSDSPFIQEDTVKDFIVDQGALLALSKSLNQLQNEKEDLLLVSLDTLQQLLSGSKKSKEKFK